MLAPVRGGGGGFVYRVLDRELGRELALKTISAPEPARALQLKAEFRSLRDVRHPNIVALHDLIVDGEHCCFTMDCVEGVPVTEHVWNGPVHPSPGGVDEALLEPLVEATAQLVSGLGALHIAGWLHRDLEPANVLVGADGRVVLLDFGLALRVAPSVEVSTQARTGVGTRGYMAPELHRMGEPTAAADLKAVGALLYESLTGVVPSASAELPSAPRDQGLDALASTAGVPTRLRALVAQLLGPEPRRRPTLAHVSSELEAMRVGGGTHEGSSCRCRKRSAVVR